MRDQRVPCRAVHRAGHGQAEHALICLDGERVCGPENAVELCRAPAGQGIIVLARDGEKILEKPDGNAAHALGEQLGILARDLLEGQPLAVQFGSAAFTLL